MLICNSSRFATYHQVLVDSDERVLAAFNQSRQLVEHFILLCGRLIRYCVFYHIS